MRKLLFAFMIMLQGCSLLPSLGGDIEEIATDNAIKLSIQKEAFSKDTDIDVQVKVKNKDK